MLSIKGKTIAYETMVKPTQNAFLLAYTYYHGFSAESSPKSFNPVEVGQAANVIQ